MLRMAGGLCTLRTLVSEGTFLDSTALRRRRLAAVAAGTIVLLALYETASALIAPLRAPSDADWAAAASAVRAQFKPGDLIVAAPAWADPVMRLHLGDLVPVAVAARMDAARYGRIWVVSQRGASAEDAAGATVAGESRHGPLLVRRYERRPATVSYDFLAQWPRARVVRAEPGRGEIPCQRLADRFQCPKIGFNFVKPDLLEIGTTLRNALYTQPVGGAAVVVEYAAVPLGRELAVGAGLHHVWLRKYGDGVVKLRVLVDGREVGRTEASNRSGWRVDHFDTSALAGRSGTVRFEITSDKPFSRHFGFAAEARS
jgi:antitoxin (DNA-binding transcriptional repressor) of toxin-antitoxin stability system